MATIPAPSIPEEQNRFKSSLTGTLVRTLLIFTLIPLALMAGGAYFRARDLLREQAVNQSGNLLINQTKAIEEEIKRREDGLEAQVTSSDFAALIETALHANPQSDQFQEIRNEFITRLQGGSAPAFDQFILFDSKGVIKVASNPEWQNKSIETSALNSEESRSIMLDGLPPLYENNLILVTTIQYKTSRGSTLGTIAGMIEKENLQHLIQPLNGLSPFANTYFILSNGRLVNSNPSTGAFELIESGASQSQDELSATLNALMSEQNQTPRALDITAPNGDPVIAQVQWFPRVQGGVVLEINASEIYKGTTSLIPFTIILVLVTLVFIGLVLFLGVKRVIQPLQSLSAITRKFAAGDWSQRAQVTRNDEVGLLATSFNHMADQLGEIYQSLEQKVDERARQIQTAAEVAQNITTILNLDDMLNKTVELLVQRFDFYQASIFMLDRSGRFADFKAGFGSATKGLAEKKYRLEVGSASIVGWVASNNQARVASDVLDDPLHLKNELLPETRSEATVPISNGSFVLGVLDVQSTQPGTFSADSLVMLQTLASQVAAAIQTANLIEASQVDLQEIERLYRSSRLIAKANNESELLATVGRILGNTPHPVAIFKAKGGLLNVVFSADSTRGSASIAELQNQNQLTNELQERLLSGPVFATLNDNHVPNLLRTIIDDLELSSAVLLPVYKAQELSAALLIGSRKQKLATASVQPYANLVDLMSIALERAEAVEQMEKHLREMEALASINELTASSSDIQSFFQALLAKIQQIIGDYNLTVALYDEKSDTISIPFSYENGNVVSIESFPLGEGLTSILLRTRQPLMLVEDTERRSAELGAKVAGQPAKSWMGVPMLVRNNPIGALLLQDLENEHAFDEDDLKFFATLAGQVAGVIHNVHLLDESKRKALQLETAAEIARDISGSLNLDELLVKAVNFIRERFDFYHAAIFLRDLPGEFAVIREATGDAGAQMKRAGYKIGVGSKSIVGFVTGRGESLVVNDTSRDATYYANPLLPETRAEAAIPLRVGERILGALDVQSVKPFVFSEDNLRSLQILADQLAIAVANTELFAETQEHLSQHRLLHHITSTAASGTTLEEALESAVNGLQVTLGGDRVAILLAHREKQVLNITASVGYAEDVTAVQIEIGKGVTGWVAAHRRPLRIPDVHKDQRYIKVSSNTRSELAVPLIYRNELLGVLNVESEQVDAYSENDEEMLGTLGGSLAAIIANARLLEQIRTQSERERLIYDAAGKIRRSTDIQSILMTTASEIARITGARFTKIKLKPENGSELEDVR